MYERMLNKAQMPTKEEMARYCGPNETAFLQLDAWLGGLCAGPGEIRFPYGNKYGWGVSHRRGKTLFCNVFPEAGAFTVMVRFTKKQMEALYPGVTPYGRAYLDNPYPCSDGGWIHFRVSAPGHLAEITQMLTAKAGPAAKD